MWTCTDFICPLNLLVVHLARISLSPAFDGLLYTWIGTSPDLLIWAADGVCLSLKVLKTWELGWWCFVTWSNTLYSSHAMKWFVSIQWKYMHATGYSWSHDPAHINWRKKINYANICYLGLYWTLNMKSMNILKAQQIVKSQPFIESHQNLSPNAVFFLFFFYKMTRLALLSALNLLKELRNEFRAPELM